MGKHQSNSDLRLSFDHWLSLQRYTSKTQEQYDKVVEQFCVFLAQRRLKTVKPLDIHEFLAATVRIGESEFRSKLTALRCFFRFLYISGAANTVAPWFIRIRRPVFKLPVVLTQTEVKRLIRAAKGARNKALIELLYATGCRLAEIVKMKVDDIDFQHRTIRVYAKRKHRVVFFGTPAQRALRLYIGPRKTGSLFLDDIRQQEGHLALSASGWEVHWRKYPEGTLASRTLGSPPEMSRREASARMDEFLKSVDLRRPQAPLGASGIEKIVRLAGRQAGIRHLVGPRMLRHSFATHILQKGADIRIIQTLLGHTWITSTQRYASVSSSQARSNYLRCHPRAR